MASCFQVIILDIIVLDDLKYVICMSVLLWSTEQWLPVAFKCAAGKFFKNIHNIHNIYVVLNVDNNQCQSIECVHSMGKSLSCGMCRFNG